MRWEFLIALVLLGISTVTAQPLPDWDKTFGSSDWDELHCTTQLKNGDFLLAGNIAGYEGNITDSVFGKNDFWIQCIDATGNRIWEKTYGGTGEDRLWSVLALNNGQFLVVGDSDSEASGNKKSQSFGGLDYWVLLLDAQGELVWEKTYGSSGNDRLFDVALHKDGGFVLAGFSDGNSSAIKHTDAFGSTDLWVLHIDEAGELIWQKQYGGDQMENVHEIYALSDGSFMLAGATTSKRTHSVSQIGFGKADMWLLKIDTNGEKLWDKRFGGADEDQAYKLMRLSDGHFLIGGTSASEPFGHKASQHYGTNDFWVIKVSPSGQLIWENSYGGTGLDVLYDAVEGADGSLYFAGVSESGISGNKDTPARGGYDFWLMKADKNGKKQWDETFGGTENDALTQLNQLADGAFVLTGHSASDMNDHKSSNSYGKNDIWMFKTLCALDLELPADADFCKNTMQSIEAVSTCSGNCTMLWNGVQGNLNHTFVVTKDETLEAQIFTPYGCTSNDWFNYTVRPDLDINLGADTAAPEHTSIILNAPTLNGNTWQWSDGSTKAFLRTEESGTYSVTVTDAEGCTGTDEIDLCICLKDEVYIPNVFSPTWSSDWENSRWHVMAGPGIIQQIDLIEIYAPQGQLTHHNTTSEVNNPSTGWDGRNRNGKLLQPGVYSYKVLLRFESGAEKTIFGSTTLIR